MRWKAFFVLRPQARGNNINNYGFNSLASPPALPELKHFEDRMIDLLQNIEFKDSKARSEFQNKLSKKVNEINGERKLFVPL